MGNGLLDADNRKSVWQLTDNLVDKPAVLGQTTELTGKKNEYNLISGLAHDKTYKLGSVNYDQDIIKNYSIPINNNMIQWDNDKINDNLVANLVSTNVQTQTDKLLKNPLGISTLKTNIK